MWEGLKVLNGKNCRPTILKFLFFFHKIPKAMFRRRIVLEAYHYFGTNYITKKEIDLFSLGTVVHVGMEGDESSIFTLIIAATFHLQRG